jgi:hypothetical protein
MLTARLTLACSARKHRGREREENTGGGRDQHVVGIDMRGEGEKHHSHDHLVGSARNAGVLHDPRNNAITLPAPTPGQTAGCSNCGQSRPRPLRFPASLLSTLNSHTAGRSLASSDNRQAADSRTTIRPPRRDAQTGRRPGSIPSLRQRRPAAGALGKHDRHGCGHWALLRDRHGTCQHEIPTKWLFPHDGSARLAGSVEGNGQ